MNAPEPVQLKPSASQAAPAPIDHAINRHCAPSHLRAVAFLYGVESIPLEQARVLELGCGEAGNLLPFAAAHPEAQVVGVDPDPARIEAGRRAAAALGLGNVTLHVMPFTGVTQDFGEFDYLIAHDVFSSLGRDDAAEILRICRLNLSYSGLAYVNFDAYPGAKALEVVREAVVLHAQGADDAEAQIAAARAALSLFQEGAAAANPLGPALAEAARSLAAALDAEGPAALARLGRQAYYYAEFADAAGQFGMVCAGDARPRTELAASHGTNVAMTHSLLGLGKSADLRRQYLDFSTGRTCREAILIHHERQAERLPRPDLSRLVQLRWASSFRRLAAEARDPAQAHFVNHRGQVLSTADRVLELAAEFLGHAWPGSVSGAALVRYVEDKKLAAQGESAAGCVQRALQQLFDQEIGFYCRDKTPYDLAGAPRLTPGLLPAARGELAGFNLWHEPVRIGFHADDQQALQRLDDGAPMADLRRGVVAAPAAPAASTLTSAGEFAMPEAELPIEVDAAAAPAQPVSRLLDRLRHYGLVVAGARQWHAYVLAGLEAGAAAGPYWQHYIDAAARLDFEHCYGGSPQPKRRGSVTQAVAKEAKDLIKQINAGADNLEDRARALVKRAPDYSSAWEALAAVLRATGRAEESLAALLRALQVGGEDAGCYASLAFSLRALRRPFEIDAACRRAMALEPGRFDVLNLLGNTFRSAARFHEAVQVFERMLAREPDNIEANGNIGVALADMGDFARAEAHYLRVLALKPDAVSVRNARFFGLNYFPDRSAEDIYKVYREFDQQFGIPLRAHWKAHGNDRDPSRRLRIGYISPDFRHHPVKLFLEPLLAHHDKRQVEVYAYAQLDVEDSGSAALKAYVDHWIRTNGMSSDALAQRIRDDRIDVLVDLAGHTANNRLAVLARKPAPVQVTWLGFGCTTGLSAIDYILTDEQMAPPGTEPLFAEQPWRLAHSNFAYRPKDGMGEVSSSPALANGHVRFLTMSRAIRFNYKVVRAWAEILKRLPTARLVVDSGSYVSTRMRMDLQAAFAAHGIGEERLEIGYRTPPWNVLRSCDITLDCFPHNSGTTLFESLYMGLPYITLAGRAGVGRIGASTLAGLGRPEWVAHSEAEYIEKAVALAGDLPALAALRAGLRAEMQASALMDEAGFACKVEAAYRGMFKKWSESTV